MRHELKINPQYYEDVKIGLKPFEIRKNDREFKLGDILVSVSYTHLPFILHRLSAVRFVERLFILQDTP